MLQRGWGELGRMEKGLKYKPKVCLVSNRTPDKDSGLRQLRLQEQTWVLIAGTGTPAHLGPS